METKSNILAIASLMLITIGCDGPRTIEVSAGSYEATEGPHASTRLTVDRERGEATLVGPDGTREVLALHPVDDDSWPKGCWDMTGPSMTFEVLATKPQEISVGQLRVENARISTVMVPNSSSCPGGSGHDLFLCGVVSDRSEPTAEPSCLAFEGERSPSN